MLNLGWVWCVKAVGVRCDMLLRGAISSVKFGYVTAVLFRLVELVRGTLCYGSWGVVRLGRLCSVILCFVEFR